LYNNLQKASKLSAVGPLPQIPVTEITTLSPNWWGVGCCPCSKLPSGFHPFQRQLSGLATGSLSLQNQPVTAALHATSTARHCHKLSLNSGCFPANYDYGHRHAKPLMHFDEVTSIKYVARTVVIG